MCESMKPGSARPASRTTSAPRPAADRAPSPTARIRPSGPAATSGSQPTNSTAPPLIGGPRKIEDPVGYSQAVGLGDDLLHYLVGPSADPRETCVAPGPLHRKLGHVAVAAQD